MFVDRSTLGPHPMLGDVVLMRGSMERWLLEHTRCRQDLPSTRRNSAQGKSGDLGSDRGGKEMIPSFWERWHLSPVGREIALDSEDKRGHCSQGTD